MDGVEIFTITFPTHSHTFFKIPGSAPDSTGVLYLLGPFGFQKNSLALIKPVLKLLPAPQVRSGNVLRMLTKSAASLRSNK